jgi:hypothetical protein
MAEPTNRAATQGVHKPSAAGTAPHQTVAFAAAPHLLELVAAVCCEVHELVLARCKVLNVGLQSGWENHGREAVRR